MPPLFKTEDRMAIHRQKKEYLRRLYHPNPNEDIANVRNQVRSGLNANTGADMKLSIDGRSGQKLTFQLFVRRKPGVCLCFGACSCLYYLYVHQTWKTRFARLNDEEEPRCKAFECDICDRRFPRNLF